MFRPRPHGVIAGRPLTQVHISLEAMSTVSRTGHDHCGRHSCVAARLLPAAMLPRQNLILRSSLAIQTLYPRGQSSRYLQLLSSGSVDDASSLTCYQLSCSL